MTANNNHTAEYILKAVESIKALRPVYAHILEFNGKLFAAQEGFKYKINLEPIKIEPDILSIKQQENFPLITLSEFRIDTDVAYDVLRHMTEIARDRNKKISSVARAVLLAVETGEIEKDELFRSLIEDGASLLTQKASQLKSDGHSAAYIIYSCIKPSLIYCRDQLSAYLQADMLWEKGYCPICGSLPGLSLLDNDGARHLVCSYCWHQWHAPRIYCPFCENRDNQTLQYFTNLEEKGYRVELCDTCKQYIKTVDKRKTTHYVYPPLELVSTLHMDLQAQDMGYQSGMGINLSI